MNIMFVLSVAVLTFDYMAKISVVDTASAPSSATLSFPGKLETEDSILPFLYKRTSDFGMIWDFVATFQGSAILS